MKLEGHTNRDLAETLACSMRSLERELNRIRKRRKAGGEGTGDVRPWKDMP
jgi:hypothetical protein